MRCGSRLVGRTYLRDEVEIDEYGTTRANIVCCTVSGKVSTHVATASVKVPCLIAAFLWDLWRN
jgi:hypothetical protein